MIPGEIILIDWRDALRGTREPNKRRPGILVGSPRLFAGGLPFEIAVPLTGEADLAVPGASLEIVPTPENGCAKVCYALAWAVQSVPNARISGTASRITDEQLRELRVLIAACIDAPAQST